MFHLPALFSPFLGLRVKKKISISALSMNAKQPVCVKDLAEQHNEKGESVKTDDITTDRKTIQDGIDAGCKYAQG